MERQWFHCAGEGCVKIHILGKTVRVEEVIASPPCAQPRQLRWIEFQRHFVAGAYDRKSIVGSLDKIKHISISGVLTSLAREWSSQAYSFVVIRDVTVNVAFDSARVAAERKRSFGKRNISNLDRRRLWACIDENLVPINFQVRSNA